MWAEGNHWALSGCTGAKVLVAPDIAFIRLFFVRKVASSFLVSVAAAKTDFPFVVSVPAEKVWLLP